MPFIKTDLGGRTRIQNITVKTEIQNENQSENIINCFSSFKILIYLSALNWYMNKVNIELYLGNIIYPFVKIIF